jgi:hypothetical protein
MVDSELVYDTIYCCSQGCCIVAKAQDLDRETPLLRFIVPEMTKEECLSLARRCSSLAAVILWHSGVEAHCGDMCNGNHCQVIGKEPFNGDIALF